ncbi:MAG: hypothetical protein J3Q66DRAFT_398087 [Benniella sp.]|nr:MAG: hypothetical protein J3Q66DRAFT_398087 [Benniella sp.]
MEARAIKSFEAFVGEDPHSHPDFDAQYTCFTAYIGRQRLRGDESAKQYIVNRAELRIKYDELLLQRTSGLARKAASSIVDNSIEARHSTWPFCLSNNIVAISASIVIGCIIFISRSIIIMAAATTSLMAASSISVPSSIGASLSASHALSGNQTSKKRKGKEKAVVVNEIVQEERQDDADEFEVMVDHLEERLFWKLKCSGRRVEDVLQSLTYWSCLSSS